MVFEAAADDFYAVGEQRRRQCVTGIAGVGAAIESKLEGAIAIDETAFEVSERLSAHTEPSCTLSPGGAEPSTSWVSVSRRTWNQRRQPAA